MLTRDEYVNVKEKHMGNEANLFMKFLINAGKQALHNCQTSYAQWLKCSILNSNMEGKFVGKSVWGSDENLHWGLERDLCINT